MINLNSQVIFLDQYLQTKEALFTFISNKATELQLSTKPAEVKKALWTREKIYATGMMHGFVLPHGISKSIKTSTIFIVKLNAPITWKMLDDSKPKWAFILIIKEKDYYSGQHMDNLQAISEALIMPEVVAGMNQATSENDIIKIFKNIKKEKNDFTGNKK